MVRPGTVTAVLLTVFSRSRPRIQRAGRIITWTNDATTCCCCCCWCCFTLPFAGLASADPPAWRLSEKQSPYQLPMDLPVDVPVPGNTDYRASPTGHCCCESRRDHVNDNGRAWVWAVSRYYLVAPHPVAVQLQWR